MTSRWAGPTVLISLLVLTSGCLGGVFGTAPSTTDDTDSDSRSFPVAPAASGVPDRLDSDVASDDPPVQPPTTVDDVETADASGSGGLGDTSHVQDAVSVGVVGETGVSLGSGSDLSPNDVSDSGALDFADDTVPESVSEEAVPAQSPSVPVGGPSVISETPETPPSPPPTDSPVTTEPVTLSGTVVAVVDGDTIRVQVDDGDVVTVDLAGVDAPELYTSTDPTLFAPVPDSPGGETYLHVWGWTADRALARELLAERVDVELLVSSSTDTSDSVAVGYVVHDGSSVNLALLESGLARATEADHPEREAFVLVETDARTDGRGLWGVTDPLSVP